MRAATASEMPVTLTVVLRFATMLRAERASFAGHRHVAANLRSGARRHAGAAQLGAASGVGGQRAASSAGEGTQRRVAEVASSGGCRRCRAQRVDHSTPTRTSEVHQTFRRRVLVDFAKRRLPKKERLVTRLYFL